MPESMRLCVCVCVYMLEYTTHHTHSCLFQARHSIHPFIQNWLHKSWESNQSAFWQCIICWYILYTVTSYTHTRLAQYILSFGVDRIQFRTFIYFYLPYFNIWLNPIVVNELLTGKINTQMWKERRSKRERRRERETQIIIIIILCLQKTTQSQREREPTKNAIHGVSMNDSFSIYLMYFHFITACSVSERESLIWEVHTHTHTRRTSISKMIKTPHKTIYFNTFF